MNDKKQKESFEKNLKRLEEISLQLESENINLEDALNLYEEGIQLSKLCMETLKNAELKITRLRKKAEEISPGQENLDI